MNVTWSAAKILAPKRRDTWTRVLLLNWWATYVVYLLARRTRISPTFLTFAGLAVGICAAAAFLGGNLLGGAVLYFAHFALDGLDGKLSRVRGEDDTRRGMWDLLCDGFVFAILVLSLAGINWDLAWYLIAWTGIHFMDMRISSIMYKLKGDLGIQGERLITPDMQDAYGKSWLIKTYTRLQERLDRWRLNAIPTVGEAAFLVFVVGPILWHLTGSVDYIIIMVWAGIALTLPGAFGQLTLAVKLAERKHKECDNSVSSL